MVFVEEMLVRWLDKQSASRNNVELHSQSTLVDWRFHRRDWLESSMVVGYSYQQRIGSIRRRMNDENQLAMDDEEENAMVISMADCPVLMASINLAETRLT